jgi:hypothetical protein
MLFYTLQYTVSSLVGVGSFSRKLHLLCFSQKKESGRKLFDLLLHQLINWQGHTVLRIRIRDPRIGAFLTPGSGIRDG